MPKEGNVWKDQEKIETIRRGLMNCSNRLSNKIKDLRISLEAIEQTQKELQSILAGEQAAGPGVFFAGGRRESRKRFDRGD